MIRMRIVTGPEKAVCADQSRHRLDRPFIGIGRDEALTFKVVRRRLFQLHSSADRTQFLGHEFVAVSKSTQEVYRQGLKFARLDANLLISGETWLQNMAIGVDQQFPAQVANSPTLRPSISSSELLKISAAFWLEAIRLELPS